MKKVNLASLAQENKVDSSGTKNDIIRRLLNHNGTGHQRNKAPTNTLGEQPSTIVQTDEFPSDVTKILSESIKNNKQNELPEELMAKNWVNAFDTKVAHRGARSNRTRDPLPKHRRHTTSLDLAEADHVQPEKNATPQNTALDTPEEMDHQWVDAFDQKVSNRKARHNLLGSVDMETIHFRDTHVESRESFGVGEPQTITQTTKDGFSWDASNTGIAKDSSSHTSRKSRSTPDSHTLNSKEGASLLANTKQSNSVSSNHKSQSETDANLQSAKKKPSHSTNKAVQSPANDKSSHMHKEQYVSDLDATHDQEKSFAALNDKLPRTSNVEHHQDINSAHRPHKTTSVHGSKVGNAESSSSSTHKSQSSPTISAPHGKNNTSSEKEGSSRKEHINSASDIKSRSRSSEARAAVQEDASSHASHTDGSGNNWLISSVIGSGLFLWIVGGERGFERMTDFIYAK